MVLMNMNLSGKTKNVTTLPKLWLVKRGKAMNYQYSHAHQQLNPGK